MRTKEEKAKHGTRKSLAYLARMAKRDPSSFTEREKYFIRKHRQDVSKFERIYGPVSVILGRPSSSEQYMGNDVNPGSTHMGIGSTVSSTSCSMSNAVELTVKALRFLERAAADSVTTSSKQTNGSNVPGMVESAEKHSTVNSENTLKGIGSTVSSTNRSMGNGVNTTGKALRFTERAANDGVATSSKQTNGSNVPGMVERTGKHSSVNPGNTLTGVGSTVSSTSCSMDNGFIPIGKELRFSERTEDCRVVPCKRTITEAKSVDDQAATSTKKAKKFASRDSYVQAAVIDRNNSKGNIGTKQWQLVETMLLDEIAAFDGSSEDVSFNGADWSKGVKIVNCGNKNSFEFLKTTIAKFNELNPGSKLDVIHASEISLKSNVTVWIPPPVRSAENILAVLAKQNAKLHTDQWRFVTSMVCKENGGWDFKFGVDRKSLEYLEEVGGIAKFGLGTVRFRFPKQNKTNK